MHNMTWNGVEVNVDYYATKYYPATFEHPEEGGDFEINHVWAELETRSGETVAVDIAPLLSEDDCDEIQELIMSSQDDD